ncbi:MAG: hypothetical protein ACD_19C00187G0019 [uncultured bacterium]|nr:MAG: hypothetical protein ACD_19C00187G0019 [uncultured bacterium]
MFNFFKNKPIELDTFALNIATIATTESGFEKLTRDNPDLMTQAHFKLMAKTTGTNWEGSIAEGQRDWENSKVKMVAQLFGEKRLNELRNKLALTITEFLNE